jgi:hypothetical protein
MMNMTKNKRGIDKNNSKTAKQSKKANANAFMLANTVMQS